jgi:hypothetical protein
MWRKQWCAGLALVFLGLAAGPAWAQQGRSPEVAVNNGWLFNYQQARRIAAEQNRPMMVVFRCVP